MTESCVNRFVCDDPRRPLYVPIIRGHREPVFVHFPVLTPDNGVIMCTTEADQFRVAYELNRLNDELNALREELRISRQSEREAWRYQPELEAERERLQARVDCLMLEHCPEDMTPGQVDNWGKHQRPASAALQAEIDAALQQKEQPCEASLLRLVCDIRFAVGDNGKRMQPELIDYLKQMRADADRYKGTQVSVLMSVWERLADGVDALLAAIDHEDAARTAWDECGCGTPEFEHWARATELRRAHATLVRFVGREFRRREAEAQADSGTPTSLG